MHQNLVNNFVHPLQGEPGGQQVGGIAERISTAIASGILNVGEKLPPEAELATQFGVAVATLRKALATLRAEGVVETRRGRNGGTFIVKSPFPSAKLLFASFENISVVTLRDFADEQAAVSGMAARLAAERHTIGKSTRLAELAFSARESKDIKDSARADGRFHVEIAVLSQSQRLLTSEQRLQAEIGPLLWFEPVTKLSKHTQFAEHLAILMAIEQKKPEEAQKLAVEHVRSNIKYLIDGKLRIARAGGSENA